MLGEQRHDGCEQFVTRQRRGCYLNPGPTAPESSTLTTRLPSHHVVTEGDSDVIIAIGAEFHRAMVATAPGEKTPHRAPPCEELDPSYDIKLVVVQKITFVLRKIN